MLSEPRSDEAAEGEEDVGADTRSVRSKGSSGVAFAFPTNKETEATRGDEVVEVRIYEVAEVHKWQLTRGGC